MIPWLPYGPARRRRAAPHILTATLLAWLYSPAAIAPARADGSEGPELIGRVVDVRDGDTLDLATNESRYRIRLAQIDTPERDQPWSDEARRALIGKVGNRVVTVRVMDVDTYGRLVGQVTLDARDVNRELVREGHAWAYRDYLLDPSLLDDEETARAAGLGLWGLPAPIAPWLYRRGARTATPITREYRYLGTHRTTLPERHSAPFDCTVPRYCRQMGSCAEARFYLNECGFAHLDGDGDGVPCEAICRR
ncbi:MAG: thermonuclease family protein [Pseudomonadales bacterium]